MTTRNITKAYRLSTDADRNAGMGWYADARAFCEALDPENPTRAAGVLAALSPLQHWEPNKRMATEFYSGRRNVHTADNVRKAEMILAGGDPDKILGGAKVRAFYANITNSASDEAVTIDRHAIAVCEGRVIPENELKSFFGVKKNRQYVSEYKRAAIILSKEYGIEMTAAQLQAVVWVYWRRVKGIK